MPLLRKNRGGILGLGILNTIQHSPNPEFETRLDRVAEEWARSTAEGFCSLTLPPDATPIERKTCITSTKRKLEPKKEEWKRGIKEAFGL